MGCCPSKVSTGVADANHGSSARKNSARNYSTVLEQKNRVTSVSKKKDGCCRNWQKHEFMVDSKNKIEPQTRMGFHNTYFDARVYTSDRVKSMQKPSVEREKLWFDNGFSKKLPQVDEAGRNVNGVTWKRPKDFVKDKAPQLFVETPNRFCVIQGSVGTCWFNAVLASLADKKELLDQIVSNDSSGLGRENYDGTFHCKLWRLGQWFDVYIDDILPTIWSGPWGAHSIHDNEMWVPLMEKAFTKFFGDYAMIGGGPSSRAFTTLTGGCYQTLYTQKSDSNSEKDEDLISEEEMFNRIERSLNKGSVLTTSINNGLRLRQNDSALQGLIPNHCYTINGAIRVTYKSKPVHLIRMRNPWGNRHNNKNEIKEWTGPWSDGSQEWNEVDSKTKKKLNFQVKNDGEFWICSDDFMKFFHHVIFSSLYPEFGNHLDADKSLVHILNILGEWSLAKYCSTNARTPDLQKFAIRIPAKGVDRDRKHHVVLQLLQDEIDTKRGQTDEHAFFSPLYLYKARVEKFDNSEKWLCLTDLHSQYQEKKCSIKNSSDVIYNYRLDPGLYIIMPSYYPERISKTETKGFCVRVFSAIPKLQCRKFEGRPTIFSMKNIYLKDEPKERKEFLNPYKYVSYNIGQLAAKRGSPKNERILKENQFLLNIPSQGNRGKKHTILIQLYQQHLLWPQIKTVPFRLEIYKAEASGKESNNDWYSISNIDCGQVYPPVTAGETTAICHSSAEICHKYELQSGLYIITPSILTESTNLLRCCIRIHSNLPISCGKLPDKRTIFRPFRETSLDTTELTKKFAFTEHIALRSKKNLKDCKAVDGIENTKVSFTVPKLKKDDSQDILIQILNKNSDFPQEETRSISLGVTLCEVLKADKDSIEKAKSVSEGISRRTVYPVPLSSIPKFCDNLRNCYLYSLKPGNYEMQPSNVTRTENNSSLNYIAIRASFRVRYQFV